MKVKCPICNKYMEEGHNYGTDTLYKCKVHGDFRIPNKELEE